MLRKFFLFAITLLFLTSCAYRPTVQQGNILTLAQVNKIKVGMRQSQVEKILGSPVLRNIYYNDQLAYAYTYQTSHSDLTKKRLVIYFIGNRVRDIETDLGNDPIPAPKPDPSQLLKKS